MMRSLCLIFAFFFIYHKQALGYKAAVLQHYPDFKSGDPEETILSNLNQYKTYADTAQGVDILVFPEYGLTSFVQDPEDYAVVLNESSKVILELKEAAKARQRYFVVNLLEKDEEPNRATKYYNTDVVFDREGTIIFKYRKINLYNEPNLTPGDPNQPVTFTTQIGTFGIFTGSDIFFDNPSRRVLEQSNVADIIYPTALVSTFPFYSSLSVQQGYSSAYGLNLLAASYGKPKEGYGGSGIYINGVGQTYIEDSASSKSIVRDVPKLDQRVDKTYCPRITPFGLPDEVGRLNITNYKKIREFHPSDYAFKDLDLSQSPQTPMVCDGEFCCAFEIIVSHADPSDNYKLMAFDGEEEHAGKKSHVRICSLLACSSDSKDSCGEWVETKSNFTRIKVTGNFKKENGTYNVPTTGNYYLLPIQEAAFCDTPSENGTSIVELSTLRAQQKVLVFGIVSRTASGAASLHAFGIVVLVVASMAKFVF